MQNSKPIVQVTRGPMVECIHRGHIVVVNAAGDILYEHGNPSYKTYARSTAKLLQVLPLVESGGADHFNFTASEIAVMCASHNGEQEHEKAVQSILKKIGTDASALLCGVHEPLHRQLRIKMIEHKQQPTVLQNNCSGKHAGMLALASYLNSPLTAYNSPEHPVQQLMIKTICELAQIDKSEVELGVDGCGVPVFGMTIDRLALAFARFGSDKLTPTKRAAACRRIISAITEHPFNLAGSERFDTKLIEVTKGRIIGKMGAEGVYAITIPTIEMGIVLKIEDGASRALHPTVVETLKQLYLLNESELTELSNYHTPPVKNRLGDVVGAIEPNFKLRKTN